MHNNSDGSFFLVFLYVLVLIQTQKDPQSLYFKKAELGDTVTLNCTVLKNQNINEELYWYQQYLGYNPQMVAIRFYTSKIKPSFKSRFTVGSNFNLTISNVHKEDEANYFCNQGGQYLNIWNNGVFLTVKGKSYICLDISCFKYHDRKIHFL